MNYLCKFIILISIGMIAASAFAQQKTMIMKEKIKRFVPTKIKADISGLSEGDKKALGKLIEAAKIMDSIYLRQVWSGNTELMRTLEADKTPKGKELLHYFLINMCPWSLLDHGEPFIDADRRSHRRAAPGTQAGALPSRVG